MRRTATSLHALEAKVIWCYLYRKAVAKIMNVRMLGSVLGNDIDLNITTLNCL
jgi:hypothetical protein